MNEFASPLASSDTPKRDTSRLRMLEALRRAGPSSRAELGRLTGMSPASVSAVTARLIASGLLTELSSLESDANLGPGRPGTRLAFEATLGVIIGVWVGLDRLVLQATDYGGNTIATCDERIPLSGLAAEPFFDTLAERISAFADEFSIIRLLGIGVAFQGFVDRSAESVIWSPVIGVADLRIGEALSARLSLPVELDNDASAMAFAIMRGDRALQSGVTACVMLGDGVGLGVFIDGQPLRGARGGGLEFGHVRLGGGGPQCRCGARGCIESYLADYAIYRDAMAVCALAPPARGRQPSDDEMDALVARAQAGERALLSLFEATGRVLAEGAAMLIHLFQPNAIVFCGPGVRSWRYMEKALSESTASLAIPGLGRATQIRKQEFRSEQLTEGVILRALDRADRRLAANY